MGRTEWATAELRSVLGRTARIWANPDQLRCDPDGWHAFSGQRNVVYNVACYGGADVGRLRSDYLAAILARRHPALLMLAGAGLGGAQVLADAEWVCVGALPLMWRPAQTPAGPADAAVRALRPTDLMTARDHLADVYGVDGATAAIALPSNALDGPPVGLWGLFEGDRLRSFVSTSVVDGVAGIWSMVTPLDEQGRGYGRRLLSTVLDHHLAGTDGSVLHSSEAGERLYGSLGYQVVEHWQLWSRPRWVMGNA